MWRESSAGQPIKSPATLGNGSPVAGHSGQWQPPATLGNGMVGVFSPWIYGQGKGRKRVERQLFCTQPPSIYLSYVHHSRQPLWAMAWWESSRHGYTDKGRVERGSNVSSTSPSRHPYICPISSTVARE